MATTVHSPAVDISDAEYVLAQLREIRQARQAATVRYSQACARLDERLEQCARNDDAKR